VNLIVDVGAFRDQEGLKKIDADSSVVISACTNDASKQRGIVLANLSKEKKKASLQLDLSSTTTRGHLLRLTGQNAEVALLPEVSIELAAREVAILGIDSEPNH